MIKIIKNQENNTYNKEIVKDNIYEKFLELTRLVPHTEYLKVPSKIDTNKNTP